MPEGRWYCVLKGYICAQLYIHGPKVCSIVELKLYLVSQIFYSALGKNQEIILSREIICGFVDTIYSRTKIYICAAEPPYSLTIVPRFVCMCIGRSEDHFKLLKSSGRQSAAVMKIGCVVMLNYTALIMFYFN